MINGGNEYENEKTVKYRSFRCSGCRSFWLAVAAALRLPHPAKPAGEKASVESTAADTAAETTASKETSSDEIVTLKWYMSINPVAPDTDKVIEKLNEYTRDKIGVEIDYTVIANPDYKEKMPTLINSGDYFDICFTANWTTNYLQFAAKDAFMDISSLLPEYAKETYDLFRNPSGRRLQ